jgi:hypothetical protein
MHYEENHIGICDLVWVEYMTRICIYWFNESVSFEIKMVDLMWVNSWLLLVNVIHIITLLVELLFWNENESLSHLFSFNLGYYILYCLMCWWKSCDDKRNIIFCEI